MALLGCKFQGTGAADRMATVRSQHSAPVLAGPFFWATWLAGKHGPLAGWVTGYLNLLGVVGISALVGHDALRGAALVVSWTKGVEGSRGMQLIIYAGKFGLGSMTDSLVIMLASCPSLKQVGAIRLQLAMVVEVC